MSPQIEVLSKELKKEAEKYKQAQERDEVFKVKKEILSHIHFLEKRLQVLQQQKNITDHSSAK